VRNTQATEPHTASQPSLPELTIRGIMLGTILTIILAAANAYLGMKLGTTVSASIPAAVISMGILRFFRNSNVLENNMVQTMASVGEALTAGVTFILPALIIMDAWQDFNYWQTMIISLLGGCLGVLFTIPLRRALLQDKSLRYPEGIAIANVLQASNSREDRDLRLLVKGGLVGSLITLFQSGFQVLTDSFVFWVQSSTTLFGFGLGLSPALIAAGFIVVMNVAISVLVGIVIGWLAGVPLLAWWYGIPDAATAASAAIIIWRNYVRYIGVGTMLVGGLWTLCTLAKPLAMSMKTSFTTLQHAQRGKLSVQPQTDRDIPIRYVWKLTLLLLVPIFFVIAYCIIPTAATITDSFRFFIAGFSTLYILIAGFIFCSISAYFAGLIGSTNNPVSGLLVSALLILCLALMAIGGFNTLGIEASKLLAVVAIGSTVVIASGIAISNDTMQDLKVGEMVGATPWKQQVMLFAGVVVSSLVIPPILQLLYQAYGIGGVFPRPGMNPAHMLAAPQAGLMATITQGAFSHHLEWAMIIIGAGMMKY
jgi:putative OPT family oligopeptide transporter